METNKEVLSGVMSESENEYDETDTHSPKYDDDIMADSNISESLDANGEAKKKYDPKDPMRPRRKKARRACFACQRAHLTCGKPLPWHSSFPLVKAVYAVHVFHCNVCYPRATPPFTPATWCP